VLGHELRNLSIAPVCTHSPAQIPDHDGLTRVLVVVAGSKDSAGLLYKTLDDHQIEGCWSPVLALC
jgi:hypothetical protein